MKTKILLSLVVSMASLSAFAAGSGAGAGSAGAGSASGAGVSGGFGGAYSGPINSGALGNSGYPGTTSPNQDGIGAMGSNNTATLPETGGLGDNTFTPQLNPAMQTPANPAQTPGEAGTVAPGTAVVPGTTPPNITTPDSFGANPGNSQMSNGSESAADTAANP
jgi:hypothetical protein